MDEGEVKELLTALEWSGLHTDYEDSWGVMTYACPCCMNAKSDGHKQGCKLNLILQSFTDYNKNMCLFGYKNDLTKIGSYGCNHYCLECHHKIKCMKSNYPDM